MKMTLKGSSTQLPIGDVEFGLLLGAFRLYLNRLHDISRPTSFHYMYDFLCFMLGRYHRQLSFVFQLVDPSTPRGYGPWGSVAAHSNYDVNLL